MYKTVQETILVSHGRALHGFKATECDDLEFSEGEVIEVFDCVYGS
jgi:SH3 domain